PHFHQRPHTGDLQRIEDLVRDRPVIHGCPVRPFRIRIGRPPLQRSLPISGGEQIMRPVVHRPFAQVVQLPKELPPSGRVEVGWFICGEVIPIRGIFAHRLSRMNEDIYMVRLSRNSLSQDPHWRSHQRRTDHNPQLLLHLPTESPWPPNHSTESEIRLATLMVEKRATRTLDASDLLIKIRLLVSKSS